MIHGAHRLRFRNLTFVDFMEAMVRVSLLVPTPSPADLLDWGVKSAVGWYDELLLPDNTEAWEDACKKMRQRRDDQACELGSASLSARDVASQLKALLGYVMAHQEA